MDKVIIIPDSFKGSMSSETVADILEKVIKKNTIYEPVKIPIADGGEGSTACILRSLGGSERRVKVQSPEGVPIFATYGILPDKTAVVEIAESSGLTKQTSFAAGKATSFGFGQLIKDAMDYGCKKFLLCLGGSATTDAGCGMAAALGIEFFTKEGKIIIPTGDTLEKVASINLKRMDKRVKDCTFTVMCDVENPLFGEKGAAYVYGPQKGASPEDVKRLDNGLRSISKVMEESGLVSQEGMAGAGAAGGAGYGCVAFLGAKLVSGINAMLDICKFDDLVNDAKLVITGEGKFDEQSLNGKVVYGIRNRSKGKPMIVFCGITTMEEEYIKEQNIIPVEIGRGIPVQESMRKGKDLLREKAEEFFLEYKY